MGGNSAIVKSLYDAFAKGDVAAVLGAFNGFSATPANIIDGGDTIVAEGRYRGKAKATGRAVDAQFAHVRHLRDGKIVRFQQYTDTRQWVAALGS